MHFYNKNLLTTYFNSRDNLIVLDVVILIIIALVLIYRSELKNRRLLDKFLGEESRMSFEHPEISSEDSAKLPEAVKKKMLKEAKPGSWYEGWRPYCMSCATTERMQQKSYGFKCGCCGNMVGWDLNRLSDSPLNKVR